jgi:phage gp29-like protein
MADGIPRIGPPMGRIANRGPALYRAKRFRVEGIKPDAISRIVRDAEQGILEDWADLCEYMLRDPHVRSVYETRVQSIAGAKLVVEPGRGRDPELAQRAADEFQSELESTSNLESLLTALVHAEGVGYAGAQHDWVRRDGVWHSEPTAIEPRDLKFDADWSMLVRTYDEKSPGGRWIKTSDQPDRFLLHVPSKLSRPTVAGDLLAIAWFWCFKRWAVTFRQEALELFADPYRVGKTKGNASDVARQALMDAMENQSANHWLVLEEGQDWALHEATNQAGEAWTNGIKDLNDEITKALLGSTLNVDVGSTGGNRALGESQFSTTILPRLTTMAKRLCATLERSWARPWCRFNAAMFGGVTPPCPRVRLELVSDEAKPVNQAAIDVGAVTIDEVRRGEGLEDWGAEKGGDRVARMPQPAPQFAPAEGAPGVPFSAAPRKRRKKPEQAQLPLTTRRATSPTSSASPSRTERVPFDRSGDRG